MELWSVREKMCVRERERERERDRDGERDQSLSLTITIMKDSNRCLAHVGPTASISCKFFIY